MKNILNSKSLSNYIRPIFGALIIVLSVTVTTAFAQSKKATSKETRVEKSVAYWNAKLKLNADQQEHFKTLLTDEYMKADSIRSNVKESKERYAALRKLRDDTHKQMESVLTPEQNKKFVAMRASGMKSSSKKMKKTTETTSKKTTTPSSQN